MNQKQIAEYSNLISNGEIKSAILFLLNLKHEDIGLRIEAISLLARLNNVESKYNSGLVDFNDYKIELNQIIISTTRYLYDSGNNFVTIQDENIKVIRKDEDIVEIIFCVKSKGHKLKLEVNQDVPVRVLIFQLLNKFDGKELSLFLKEQEYLDAVLCKEFDNETINLNSNLSLKENNVMQGDSLFILLKFKNNTFFKI
jgi:hypothetical protein